MKLKKKPMVLRILFSLNVIALATVAMPAQAAKWDMNDVSYLFPLPANSHDANYLRAQDFVPATWFTKNLADDNGLPFSLDATLIGSSSPDEYRAIATASFNQLRLLAIRVDPCFRDLFSDPCRPQIRAIWQPLDQSHGTVDAAMHTFYDLSPTEFQSFTQKLQALKSKYNLVTAGLPLQIHPGFKNSGFTGDFFALLKTSLRLDHLSRIAFLQLLGAEFQWRFQSFNVKNGALIPIQIPIHDDIQQTFAVHGGGIPPGTLELSSEDLNKISNGENQSQVLLDYALRIENPRLNIPGVTDCLSCHAAGGVKGASAQDLDLNPIPTVASVVGLIGKYNLKNTTKNLQDPIHFRAFGYVFQAASISDRVIIETALVADELNKN